VEISGLPNQQVRIDLHQAKMAELRIPMNQVIQAVQRETLNIPGGSVNAGTRSFSVKTSGSYQSIEQIQNTIVSSTQGRNVLLRDIADIYPSFGTNTHITRLNGYQCVLINAAQKEGENISQTQEQYKATLANFKNHLPDNVDMILSFDQGNNVDKRLTGLGIDFL